MLETYTAPPLQTPVRVLYGGGTISSVRSSIGYREGGHALSLVDLMEYDAAPELVTATRSLEVSEGGIPYTGLSENLTPAIWQKAIDPAIQQEIDDHPETATLLTHGTDTLEFTARHLQEKFGARLEAIGKRVVLTGANDDVAEPNTDAWENLSFALQQAADPILPGGVWVAYHGELIPADEVAKVPYYPGMRPTFRARSSAEYLEAEARQQTIVERQIHELVNQFGHQPDPGAALIYDAATPLRANHRGFIKYMREHPNVNAILLTLYHSGTANTDRPLQSVAKLVQDLRSDLRHKNLVFFGATETGEPTDLRAYETSVQLREAGVVPLYNMNGDVAITKLRLLDPKLLPRERIKQMLEPTIGVGEIDRTQINQLDVRQLVKLYSARRAQAGAQQEAAGA